MAFKNHYQVKNNVKVTESDAKACKEETQGQHWAEFGLNGL